MHFLTEEQMGEIEISDQTNNESESCEDYDPISAEEAVENVELEEGFVTACEIKLLRHLRCASHTLNLIATTDLLRAIKHSRQLKKTHFNVLEKCTSLWKSLRSPKTNEILRTYLGIALKKPIVTRWNSFHDAIIQLLQVKEKLLSNPDIILGNPLQDTDFEYFEEYVLCTRDLALATDRLQGDSCHYEVLLSTLVSLKNKMNGH